MIWKAIQRWSSLDSLRHHYILDFSRDCCRLMTLDWTCVLNMNVFLALNVFYMPDIIDMESVTQKISWIFGRLGLQKADGVPEDTNRKRKNGGLRCFFFFFYFFSLKKAIKRLNTESYHFLLMILMGNDFDWIFFFLTSACKAL